MNKLQLLCWLVWPQEKLRLKILRKWRNGLTVSYWSFASSLLNSNEARNKASGCHKLWNTSHSSCITCDEVGSSTRSDHLLISQSTWKLVCRDNLFQTALLWFNQLCSNIASIMLTKKASFNPFQWNLISKKWKMMLFCWWIPILLSSFGMEIISKGGRNKN